MCVLNPYTCTLFYMYPYKMFVACTAGRNASCVVGVIRLVHAEALSGASSPSMSSIGVNCQCARALRVID